MVDTHAFVEVNSAQALENLLSHWTVIAHLGRSISAMDRSQLETLSNVTLLQLIADATAVLLARASRPPPTQLEESTSSSADSWSSIVTESWAVLVCRLLHIPIFREDGMSEDEQHED